MYEYYSSMKLYILYVPAPVAALSSDLPPEETACSEGVACPHLPEWTVARFGVPGKIDLKYTAQNATRTAKSVKETATIIFAP